MDQQILRGRGSLARVRELMDRLHISRPLLVCEKWMAEKLPLVPAAHFDGYHPNPDFSDCMTGAALYRENGCDGLISLGGGSSMDTAKGIKAILTTSAPEDAMKSRLPDDADLPHIAIPGTAGTGSEATAVAVLYVDGQKLSLNHPRLVPDGVVLDSTLLDTLLDYHKKACALDALSQGVESYWAAKATEESRVHAARAIRGVLGSIRAYLAGDEAAADAMQEAAWESGRAIRFTATTAAHAMSYQITKKLGLAHGHACITTLPTLWERLLRNPAQADTMAGLAEILGIADACDAPDLIRGLVLDIGMAPGVSPDEAMLDYLADTVNVERLSNHPECLTRDELRMIYVQSFVEMTEADRAACLDLWRHYGK